MSMLSGYFNIKTKSNTFHKRMDFIINSLKEKRVLIYGAGAAFIELNKQYNLVNNLNIAAIADKKFENNEYENFFGLKTIMPKDIVSEEFDAVIIMNEYYEPIVDFIRNTVQIQNDNIIIIFEQTISDERNNLNYLYNLKYDIKLTKLAKKLKNKKVVLYGAGAYLKLIFEYFDMSQFNIDAVSDMRFQNTDEKTFCGYKVCAPQNIEAFKPDYVLISTKYYINIFEFLQFNILKNTNIKILPLIDKPLLTLIKELWRI